MNALLNEIGQLLAADRDYPVEPTLLYAQLDDNMVGESIFKELGNQVLYRWAVNRRLPAALLELWEAPAYPADLAERLGVSRQIMSNHLACLRGCGLVVSVPEGRRSRYELADARIGHVLGDLLKLVLVVDPACTCVPESAAELETTSAQASV